MHRWLHALCVLHACTWLARPAAAAPSAPAITKLTSKKVELATTEVLIARDYQDLLVSPDGKTVVHVTRDGDARALGRKRPIAHQVWSALAFASDGSSFMLRTRHGKAGVGILVLRAPSLQRVYASKAAEHAHYASARTIAFHEDGVPKLLDVTTGKVATLGPKLPEFACPDSELGILGGSRTTEAACPARRWTELRGVDEASGRWILADVVGTDEVTGPARVRAVDPKTGASTTLAEVTGPGAYLAVAVSPYRDVLCISKVTRATRGGDEQREVRCGSPGGALIELYRGPTFVVPSFVGRGRVAINTDWASRIIDLDTGAAIELAGGQRRAFHQSWTVVGRDAYTAWGTEAVWQDLEDGRWATLGETGKAGSLVGIDPAVRGRVFVTHFVKDAFRTDLYELRWKERAP